MEPVRSGEILFVKSVKDGIPNRDPLRESDARRVFGEEDGRISLSDVSIKRDVRDYVLSKFPDGGPDKNRFIFVREERSEDGRTLLGRGRLAASILQKAGKSIKKSPSARDLCDVAFDVRVFGAVYSVEDEAFHLTGPVQFGWAHSMHPVESRYVQGTVVMPSTERGRGDGEGKTQGTIWTTYLVPFAVFVMPGIVHAPLGKLTGLAYSDVELLLEGLWNGTRLRQARGRGIQQPLFLMFVEYEDPFFRAGFWEETVHLRPPREAWLREPRPSALRDIELDVTAAAARLHELGERVARVRYWMEPSLRLTGREALEAIAGPAQPIW